MKDDFYVELQIDRDQFYVVVLKNVQTLIPSAPSDTMYYDDRDGFVIQKVLAKKYFFKFYAKHAAKKLYRLFTKGNASLSMIKESAWSERVAP